MQSPIGRRRFVAGALVAFAFAIAPLDPSRAETMDPAARTIETYYATLLPAVNAARGLSVAERARHISPAIAGAFDIASMTRLSVGRPWSSFSESERSAMIEAFGKFLIADYANQLSDYSGEGYTVDGNVEARGGDQIVKTRIGATEVNYLMRGRRIVDVYANGVVSELAARRAEFESILASGSGANGLIQTLRARTQQLLGG